MTPKNSASTSNKARPRSRKTNGDATPAPEPVRPATSTDPILDDLLGLNRKAFQVAGRRIEFRRDGEFSTLKRRQIGVLTLERQRLSILCVPDVRMPDVVGALAALGEALKAANAITDPVGQSAEEAQAAEDALLKVVLEQVLTARQALESPPLPTAEATTEDCDRLDEVIREIGALIMVGDLSEFGPLDLEHIIDIFFQLRLGTIDRTTLARASIASTLAQTSPTI